MREEGSPCQTKLHVKGSAMIKFVDVEALNLRSEPVVVPATRIILLHLGQCLETVSDSPRDGWWKVRLTVDGVPHDGFVMAMIPASPATGFVDRRSLRDPVSDTREALVAEAVKQWQRFDGGQGKEHRDPYSGFIATMWQAIGQNLSGRDRDVPWSAAAISFMVRQAGQGFGIYRQFRFAPAHSRYMHDAIKQRRDANLAAPFWGFELHERRPEVGDIIGRWRETPRDFADAEASDSFKSHTDIVVSVGSDEVLAIGGNVSDSVGITHYRKLPSGFLSEDKGVFILMVNNG